MKRIYAKEEVCIGCKLCEVYCIAQHSKSGDIIKAFKRENPRPVARIIVEEEGALSFGLQCRHCDEPACVYSCLGGGMQKNPDGTVTVDEDRCIGCWTCILACPYGVIRRSRTNKHVAAKCDMCSGIEVPACVANCPNEALQIEEVENE